MFNKLWLHSLKISSVDGNEKIYDNIQKEKVKNGRDYF